MKNDQHPLARALSVLFWQSVHLLEIGAGHNKSHASSLEKSVKLYKSMEKK